MLKINLIKCGVGLCLLCHLYGDYHATYTTLRYTIIINTTQMDERGVNELPFQSMRYTMEGSTVGNYDSRSTTNSKVRVRFVGRVVWANGLALCGCAELNHQWDEEVIWQVDLSYQVFFIHYIFDCGGSYFSIFSSQHFWLSTLVWCSASLMDSHFG